MIMKFLGKLSNVKLYLFIAAGSALALGGAYTGGYFVGARNEARVQIREVEKRIYVPVKEIQEVQVRNVQRERVLQTQLSEAQNTAADLRRSLAATGDPSPDACLNPDAVRLLNQAIANGAPAGAASVDPSATECVAPRDLELWAVDAAEQYNDVAARHNALIDFAEEELIEPQRNENDR